MKIFLTYLITEQISREPEVLDYAFVYEMITLWEEEENKVKPRIKKLIQEEHKKNFALEVDYTSDNLKHIGVDKTLTPDFKKYKSKKIDKLVDRNFNKLDKKVKSQKHNAINTKDIREGVNLLETTLKNEKKSQSLVNSLCRFLKIKRPKCEIQ